MLQIRRLDSWVTWGVVGVAIGLSLGVNTASVVLVAIGLLGFLVYLGMPGDFWTEELLGIFPGRLYWIALLFGFIVRAMIRWQQSRLGTPAVAGAEDSREVHAQESEGSLFAAGPVFIIGWMLGFIVRGLLS